MVQCIIYCNSAGTYCIGGVSGVVLHMQLLGSVCLLWQGLHTFPETSFGVSANSTGCLVFDMVLQLQSQSLGVVASVSSRLANI